MYKALKREKPFCAGTLEKLEERNRFVDF